MYIYQIVKPLMALRGAFEFTFTSTGQVECICVRLHLYSNTQQAQTASDF